MHFVPIRTRIRAVIALSIALVTVVLSGVFVSTEVSYIRELQQRILGNAVRNGAIISYTIAPVLVENDYTRMGQIVAHFAKDPDCRYVAILDRDNRILAHSAGNDIGSVHEFPGAIVTEQIAGGVVRKQQDPGGVFLEIAHPIQAGDLELGSVRIGLSADLLRQETNRIYRALVFAFGTALAVSALGMVFASLVAQRIASPILQLKASAERIGSGDYDQPVEIASNDEIGLVADAFRSMTRELKDSRSQLVEKEALRASEARLSEAQRIAHVGDWDWEIATGKFTWSDEQYRIYGAEPRSIAPDYGLVLARLHPDSRAAFLAAVDAALKEGRPFELNYRILRMDGAEATLHSIGRVVRDAAGAPVRLIGISQDVTERMAIMQKIRQSEEYVRRILDSVDEGFVVLDREYRILQANKAFCAQTDSCEEKIVGSRCYEVSHRLTRPCHEEGEDCPVKRVFETGAPHAVIHRHRHDDGERTVLEIKAYPIVDAAGAVVSAIETVTDITEKHLLEEERLKTQKLESVGTLAGGIAHDFNNLLQGIFGYISLAKLAVDKPERSLALLEQAEAALRLSVNLTTQLLTFSKGGKPVKTLIAVGPAVESAVKFALSGARSRYELSAPADLWPVEADEGQLSQVVQNIVLNANEAMAGGGTITVSLANVDIAKNTVVGLPGGGPFVRLAIQDSGCGIPERLLPRIFDPYYTTKQKGSGLGLATSYSIIKNHGGVLEATSEVNRGTVFTIHLPASPGAQAKTAPPATLPATSTKGRILLMDDENLVRNLAQTMIAALGHDVVSAVDGEMAIALFRQARAAGNPFDLIILDLTIKGGVGGEETIRTLREIDPGVKAVVSSGYADSPVLANYREHGFAAALVKPYQIDSLKRCLDHFFT